MSQTYRNILLINELDKSIKYLRFGLGEIQKITAANDFYEPVLLFLSGGFERLFKVMLCLNYKEKTGELPTTNKIWNNKNGHDIVYLKKEVEKICIPINIPIAANDYDIIQGDTIINEICKVLTDYAKRGRYFEIDAILGGQQQFEPKKEWEKIELKLNLLHYGEKRFYELIQSPDMLEKIISNSNQLMLEKLETFIRAVVRQFLYGNFYSKSQQLLSPIDDFLFLEDNQIGKTNYSDFEIHERIKR